MRATIQIHRLYWLAILALVVLAVGCMEVSSQKRVTVVLRVSRELVPGNVNDFMVYKETQAALLKSTFVLDKAIRELDGQINVTPEQLHREIRLELDETELIHVSLLYGDRTAEQTVELLEEVLNAYENEIVNKERVAKVTELAKVRKRYAELSDSVRKKTDQLAKLESELVSARDTQSIQLLERRIEAFREKAIELSLERIDLEVDESDETKSDLANIDKRLELIHERIALDSEVVKKSKAVDSGDVEVRREELNALRRDIKAVGSAMQALELDLDRRNTVQVLQGPELQ